MTDLAMQGLGFRVGVNGKGFVAAQRSNTRLGFWLCDVNGCERTK